VGFQCANHKKKQHPQPCEAIRPAKFRMLFLNTDPAVI